jgi:glycosyltransferase involved in cell wall biosynthesis
MNPQIPAIPAPGVMSALRWLTSLLGIAALAWILNSIDLAQALQAWRGVPLWVWMLCALGLVGSHVCRAGRLMHEWRNRVSMHWGAAWRLSVRHSAWVVLAPLRAGEGIYLWTLKREAGIGLREASVSLMRLRLQDALTLSIITAGAVYPGPWPGRVLLMFALLIVCITGLPRLSPLFDASRVRWIWAISNWALKLTAIAMPLLWMLPVEPLSAGLAALGGELAAALPLQPPAGLGPYEAGVILGMQWHSDLAWQSIAAAAIAVHLLSLLVTLFCACVAAMMPRLRLSPLPDTSTEETISALTPVSERHIQGHLLQHHLSVVVPMFNEAENAALQLQDIGEALADYPMPWELIVVDDGSTDGTSRALRAQALLMGEHVRVLELSRNFRQTAAMQAGIDAARGDVIVTMDGDRQNDPRDIPRLVARLLDEDLDLVAGWRQERQDGLLIRKLPSWVANRLIRKVSGLKFQDLGCSLKAFRGSVLRQVRLYGEMHRFIPAWLATVTSPGRMAEEPVNHHARRAGHSKYGLSRTFRVMVDLLAMVYFLRFGTRPGHFFGGIGLTFAAAGTAILAYLVVLKMLGESIGGRPLLWLGFFAVLAGVQMLTTGVLAEILMRTYVDRQAARSYHLRAEPTQLSPDQGWYAEPRR